MSLLRALRNQWPDRASTVADGARPGPCPRSATTALDETGRVFSQHLLGRAARPMTPGNGLNSAVFWTHGLREPPRGRQSLPSERDSVG
jgi:hypothetical protein